MIKSLSVQGVPVKIACNGALPIIYRNLTGHDLLMDEAKITRYGSGTDFSFSEIYDIIWAMAALAGYNGSEMDFYAQFPQRVDIFGLWSECMELLTGDLATKKE